jgi:hypothetical protein
MTLGVWKGRYWRERVITQSGSDWRGRSKQKEYRLGGFVTDYKNQQRRINRVRSGEDFFPCEEDLMAARILSRRAFNLINPVASLWSYADASPSIVAIFGS